ncbi:hypothetical protein QUF55_02085 [Clostridiaceae bacterium HSG29]|nr:hypothetical protein [Clostridiaceae bacterium HSG29]
MKFIKRLIEFILVLILLVVLLFGVFIFLIHTSNTELPNEISETLTNSLSYSDYMNEMNFANFNEISETDLNMVIDGTLKQFENSLVKFNYGYVDISKGSAEVYLNVTPKIEKYKLNKLNMELIGKISLIYNNKIAEIKIENTKVSKLKLPDFIVKEIITTAINELDIEKVKYFDSDNMVLLLDFSNLFFQTINFEEDKVTYELIFTKNDAERIVREKFNKFDFKDLEMGEVDDLIIIIETLPETEQSKILQYLKENVDDEIFTLVKQKLE